MRALIPLLICLSCFATEVTNLPVIRLEVKEPVKSDVRVACTALLTTPKEQDGTDAAALPAQIKYRGASSQGYDKKSFSLKLAKPKGWLGMPANREWVLNAAFVDASMMRHKLSYDLFRAMGTATSPRFAAASRFVEVELNGRYHGVYLLMQPVDDLLVGLPPAEKSDVTPAGIYKAVDHAANFAQPGHDGFEQRQPDPAVQESWGPLDDLYRFVSQAPDKDFFDPTKGISSRMDMDNAIDFHLLVLMTSNLDGITKNYNLVRHAATATNPNPKFFFVPWDYDATFGRNWDGSHVDAKAWLSNRLFDRLLSNAEYKVKYALHWKALRASLLTTENLSRMMDENVAALGPAALRNEKRWKNLNYANPRELTSSYDVVQMKRWVPLRLEWLDTELSRLTSK